MDRHPASWSLQNIRWIECRVKQATIKQGVKHRPMIVRMLIRIAVRRAMRQERCCYGY
jgi:hypothetical protein